MPSTRVPGLSVSGNVDVDADAEAEGEGEGEEARKLSGHPDIRTVRVFRWPIVWERPVLLAVCTLPAATATTAFHDPTRHSRAASLPTASTVPSRRRPIECRLPAASAGASGRTVRFRLGDQFQSRLKSRDSVDHERLP